jgi:glycine cleavage system regulatory protein
MFHMRARLSVPGAVAVATLREELAELEIQTNLDIRLTPVTPEPDVD